MSQLALDLRTEAAPTLANFVAGRNHECLACLAAIAEGERRHQLVYLWGRPGSGRSHLLQAMADAGGRLLGPGSPLERFAFSESCTLYLADDVPLMDDTRQHALFHLINQVRADPPSAVVSSGDAPPLALTMRDDLRTRLGWGLTFELHPLSDQEKAAALAGVAARRGLTVAADVIPWLLTRTTRDMRVLLELFDALDRHALARQRAITLPLLRDWLRSDEGQRFAHRPPDRQD